MVESTLEQKLGLIFLFHLLKKELSSKKTNIKEVVLYKKHRKIHYFYFE